MPCAIMNRKYVYTYSYISEGKFTMKKMPLAIFLIILVVFVFAGCLSFSGTISTSTTEPEEDISFDSQENTTSVVVIPGVQEDQTSAGVTPENTTAPSPEVTTAPSNETPIQNQAPASSEYDILKSGSFHMVGKMVDKTGVDAPMEIAITPDSIYMLSDFSGVPMGMLIKNNKVYMIYPDKKAYLELSDSLMSMAGLDISELTNSDAINFGSYGNLSEADSVTEVTHDGRVCQVYHFKVESGESRVYLDGTKLVRLSSYDKNGKFLTATDITTISGSVPADKSAPPSSFKAHKGMTGLFSFMTLLEGVIE